MIIRINPEKCTGCRACEVFCSLKQENSVNPSLSRVLVKYNEPHNIFLPVLCLPCSEKPCLTVCPEIGAMVIDSHTGAVQIIEELCTACSKCISACEIGAIHFLRMTGRGKNKKAVVIKCDQCGGDPWCVQVCEPRALEYVDDPSGHGGQVVYDDLKKLLDTEIIKNDHYGEYRRVKGETR